MRRWEVSADDSCAGDKSSQRATIRETDRTTDGQCGSIAFGDDGICQAPRDRGERLVTDPSRCDFLGRRAPRPISLVRVVLRFSPGIGGRRAS